MSTAADLLLVNANVLSMDPRRPRATAGKVAGPLCLLAGPG